MQRISRPPARRGGCWEQTKRGERLRLVTQTLLVAILLHALAALVLGDFRLPALLQGSHRGVSAVPRFAERNASIGWERLQPRSSDSMLTGQGVQQQIDVLFRLHF